jgi:hypothetical protein
MPPEISLVHDDIVWNAHGLANRRSDFFPHREKTSGIKKLAKFQNQHFRC